MAFREIDPSTYDWAAAHWAQKTAAVTVDVVGEGTKVTTRMRDGLIETETVAQGGRRALVTNPGGERYLVSLEVIAARYDRRGDMFVPKPSPIRVLPLEEDVCFVAPWGAQMRIAGGGVLAQTAPDNIYGIQAREFAETYRVLAVTPDASRAVAMTAAIESLAARVSPFDA